MPKDDGGSGPDLHKMFDLDRSTLVKSFVQRMEECMRQQQISADDLKEVIAECVEQEFVKRDILAMKKIAKLRLQDKGSDARDQLEALQRIGRAAGFDLFDWAEFK